MFGNGIDNKEDFLNELSRLHQLLERDAHIGIKDFPIKETDLITVVSNNVALDVKKGDYEPMIYRFINMLITNYRNEHVFIDLVNYFMYLNSIKDIRDITDDEKPFISNCYKLMRNDKDGTLSTNNEYYEAFLERIEEIKIDTDKRREEVSKVAFERKIEKKIEKRIKEEINKKAQEQMKMGVKVDEIDFDKILKDISLTMDL